MIINLALYSTSHCHLCEIAESLLKKLAAKYDLKCAVIEIADDSQLSALYEAKIPVLKRLDNNMEIYWPFSETDIELFINNIDH
jgi:hypothetical protein